MAENITDFDSVNEDTVQCLFFITSQPSDANFWKQLCKQINNIVETLSNGYIWHKDKFMVCLPIDQEKPGVPFHLISKTSFGDNIEDEWFIVYLILEITKNIQELIVHITDSDGDFLLIEAADYLQSWANPENTLNRVFIYNNHIHIIPPAVVDINTKLKLQDALRIVAQLPKQTEVSSEIQQAILRRIGNYPEKIKDNTHRAIVKLPLDIATLLKLKPLLISPMVNTYCSHDIIEEKSCRNIKLQNCVTVEVEFTKCLYAMLKHSKLIKSTYSHVNESDNRSVLGLKLACGYQMIMSRLSKDIFCSKEYIKFVNNLKQHGYFRGNIEGSKDYKQLLENAKDYFANIACPSNLFVSNNISKVMATEEYIKLKESIKLKQEPKLQLTEDNEDWLNIDPNQLNNLLNSRYGKQVKFSNENVVTAQTVTTELSNFLKQTSNFEGIETKEMDNVENGDIEFDSEEFVNALQKMLNVISEQHSPDESSDFSDNMEDSDDNETDEIDKVLANELEAKLQCAQKEGLQDSKSVFSNIMQSLKEEEGSSGPSSNILGSIGINKTYLLDSDDENV